MKNLLIIFFTLFSLSILQAQAIQEANKRMSQGEQNSFTMEFNIGNAETIADLWVDYQKGFKARKPKLNKKENEYFADDARIEAISDNTIDIYSKVAEKSDKGAVLTVWFGLGGAYLSSSRHQERMAGAKEWLAGFDNVVKTAFMEEAMEEEKAALKNLEKELKDIEKEQKDAQKTIESLEQELQAARQKAEELAKAAADKKAAIMLQEKAVETTKSRLKKLD